MSARNAETWYLRDAIRDALWTRTPQTGPQLFERVTSEYGHVDERRMWRHLAWLIERGIAVRVARWRVTSTDDIRGYVRGTGVEYAADTASRIACDLASDGRCIVCRGRAEPDRPKWMASRCVGCHWTWHAEMKKALREARIATGDCGRCGDPTRPGLKECAECARQQQERKRRAA